MALLHLLCLLLAVCHALSAGDTTCPGGYAEGTTIDIGSYWYECKDGRVVPKGCLTEDRMRVEIQETYESKSFRMQCVLDSAGQLTLNFKSCIKNGRDHAAGESWEDGSSWYTCTQVSNYLRVETGGCVDNGRRVNLDGKVARDQLVYVCKKNSEGTPTLTPWGCVSDGTQYAVGEQFDQGNTVYMCTANADKVYAKCVGCLHEQRRLGANDRFTKEDVIYECVVEENKTGFKPSACVQRSETGAKVERRLGCFWIEGQPPYQYQMTCKHDDNAGTAVKVVTKCVYKVTQGTIVVEPGCYSVLDKTAIACIQDSSGVNLRAFRVDDSGYVNVPGGIRKC